MDALQRASLAMTAFSAGTRTVRMAWLVVGDTDLSVQDLVGGDTAGLDGGVPDLDTVLHPEGEDDGEVLAEVSHLVLGNPARRDSSHVFAACVRLTFDLPVHRSGLSYHLNHLGL